MVNDNHSLQDNEETIHRYWDNNLDPVLTIESGDVVNFKCPEPTWGAVTPDTVAEDLYNISTPGHALLGPVEIADAEPGDVLQIDLLSVNHGDWGFTIVNPGKMNDGLLPERFEEPEIYIWDLSEGVGEFVNGIEVPLDPFPGVVGLAPSTDGRHSTSPPRNVGGNLDVKHLTEGSTVYLPVEVTGGLFSIGDGHAAQGDGEVCITAIETALSVTVGFELRSDMDIDQPQFETNSPFTPTGRDESMYCTTGISDDLMDAAKQAVSAMIDHLCGEYSLSSHEAYILCSVAVDLKVNELVNAPNWVVSAYLPKSILP
ncbi:acetamidase/formamidase family protein [Halorubrum trueperi]|uniref:Acetamidase/formamidase family protein n=1 Tax=Halorubrum trueperi TaxID=2004704 RepID=A0ABD5UJV3_9EURY